MDYQIILATLAALAAIIAYYRRGWFSMLAWANISVFYLLLFFNIFDAHINHAYGRVNLAILAISDFTPTIIYKLHSRWSRHDK